MALWPVVSVVHTDASYAARELRGRIRLLERGAMSQDAGVDQIARIGVYTQLQSPPHLLRDMPDEIARWHIFPFLDCRDLSSLSEVLATGMGAQARQEGRRQLQEAKELSSHFPLLSTRLAHAFAAGAGESPLLRLNLFMAGIADMFQVDASDAWARADIGQLYHHLSARPSTPLLQAICSRLVDALHRYLPFLPRLQRNIALVLAAVGYNGKLLKHAAPSLKRHRAIVRAAVMTNGKALKYADPVLQRDPEIVLAAMRNNARALKHARPELKRDRVFMLAAVRHRGFLLRYAAPELQRDRDIVLAAVDQSSHALRYADPALKADRGIVLAAVRKHGWALWFADQTLRGDREVVLTAVRQYGQSLEHAHAALKSDREIVLAAVSQDGWALTHAAPALKADREIVLAAVKNNARALQHADRTLQHDPEILCAAGRRSGMEPC